MLGAGSRTLALFRQSGLKTRGVNRPTTFARNHLSQIERKPKRVVQLESIGTDDGPRAAPSKFVYPPEASFYRLQEPLFLGPRDGFDMISVRL